MVEEATKVQQCIHYLGEAANPFAQGGTCRAGSRVIGTRCQGDQDHCDLTPAGQRRRDQTQQNLRKLAQGTYRKPRRG
jgi:hypothetical protein